MSEKSTKNTVSKRRITVTPLVPALILSFVFSFMLFVYEPISMYSANINDFWFDMRILVPESLKVFGIFFAIMVFVFADVYLLNSFASKKFLVYRIFLTVFFLFFIACYIQGTFLSGKLPALDGSVIDWKLYGFENNLTIGIWSILATLGIIGMIMLKPETVYKITGGVCAAIFVMLSLSLVQNVTTHKAMEKKNTFIATDDNFSTASSEKNFIIFLLDAVESREFGNIVESDDNFKKVFEDFTYFPDTLGGYPCTRDTMPLILAGSLNKNEKAFSTFSTEAYNNSPFFEELVEKNYDINLYDPDMIWYGEKKYSPSNWSSEKKPHIIFPQFFMQEVKYAAYKYLPYAWKRVSGIATMDFNSIVEKFRWDDLYIYSKISNEQDLKIVSDVNMFRFIHSEGAHIPFNYDEKLNYVENGTYEMKIKGCITMADAFIRRLKENGVYDNSVIIFMADHGNTNLNESDDMFRRANPLFMVKGIGEKHDFTISDTPVSYLELMDAYSDLLDGKPAGELFSDLDPKRPRTFMWYRNFRHEDHMVEYQTTSKAWEWDKMYQTGNVYDLNPS